MKTKNKSFGESFKEIFNVGDLVEWKLYKSDAITGEIEPLPLTGVITKIYKSKMSARHVWFATVFEATTGQFYNMSLMTLSLIKD
jgi:hypothetical protein|tara:strand:- start:771 stop:1025 length:255 start_codon:yes stop_codon:yes gene_type:complete